MAVTGPETLRRDPEGVDALLLRSSSGVSVPLRNVANVYLTEARTAIQHEASKGARVVTATPKGDPRRYAEKARAYLAEHVTLPPGVYLTFDVAGGEAAGETRSLLALGAAAFLAMIALLTVVLKDGPLALLVLVSTAFSFLGGIVAGDAGRPRRIRGAVRPVHPHGGADGDPPARDACAPGRA
ncbi:MAG: efflux RND transporter permease subunit [Caulobacteraceae bacterium]